MPAARLLRAVAPDAPADADLLGRFVAARDEAAFAELVRRHGPAVLAVCRRVTTRTHDAEDAFQAAFLVLARKAHRVRAGEPLAAWLYGVAVRAARKAAVRTFRRHERETLMADLPDVPDRPAEPVDPDASRVVMEEVNRLSAKYRAAVVLCELEGRSRAAAARELGIAEGTLSSRLAEARKHLARRLSARGFGPAALAALVGVAVPPELATSAVAPASGEAQPAAVAALAHEVLRTMLLRKLLPVALAVAAVIGVTVGLSAALQSAPAAPPPKADPLPAAAPRIVAVVNNRLVRLDPDGKNSTPITPAGETVGHDARPRLSPDGSRVAYRVRPPGARANDPDDPSNLRLYVRRTDGTGSRTDLGRTAESYTWTPDGTALAVSTLTPPAAGRPEFGFEHAVVTVADAAAAPLRLPADQLLTDRTRDGTLYLTQSVVSAAREPDEFLRLALWRPDGTRHARVNPPGEMLIDGRLSPDDRRVLCLKLEPLAKRVGAEPYRLVVADVATGQTTRVASVPDDVGIHGYCWSPDGRRVAYARTRPARGGGSESALVACDPDGGNPRTLATGTSPTAGAVTVAGVDWR